MKASLAIDPTWIEWQQRWGALFREQATQAMLAADPGHGIDHVGRVVRNAEQLGAVERAKAAIVLPAAWLHDCVLVAKNSPERSMASRLAAKKAGELLERMAYPEIYQADILHAIESHSFSAAIDCRTIEAQVVQDADRLEALGAIGIARCLMTAGSLGQALYHLDEPFPIQRQANDRSYSVDHFFSKLFTLPATMKTASGRVEAEHRVGIMVAYLKQLALEIHCPIGDLEAAMEKLGVAPVPTIG